MVRHTPIVMSQAGVRLDMPRARIEAVYGRTAKGFSPALRDNARVLTRLIRSRRGEFWHFFFAPNPKTSTVARAASGVRRARTIQTVCSAPHPDVSARGVLFADRVIVLSEHTQRRFLAEGIAASRMRLIRPAVPDLTPIEPARISAARRRLGLPVHRPILLYAGDLEFGRGAELALSSFIDLPSTLDACLVMACRAKTRGARARAKQLEERASRARVGDRVVWFGETPFIHDLLAVADVVTLPADTLYAKMDVPLVLVEAMALGRAVLVGRDTPAAELASAGGAVAVETERDAVSRATRSLLEDASRRSELGDAAHRIAKRDYDARRMTEAYEAVYDELV